MSLLGIRERWRSQRLRNGLSATGTMTQEQLAQIPDDVLLGQAADTAARVEKASKGAIKGGSILEAIGSFFQAIVHWLESPEGNAFLTELGKDLLALLGLLAVA